MARSIEECQLCYGDEWISEQDFDYERCTEEEKKVFMDRIGKLGGVMTGRMLCPRCRK